MTSTVGVVGDDARSWVSEHQPAAANPGPAATPQTDANPAGAAHQVPTDAEHGDHTGLLVAVDGLESITTEPVHAHSARYHEVHTMLQDALSATERTGA